MILMTTPALEDRRVMKYPGPVSADASPGASMLLVGASGTLVVLESQ
jgi:uncharacterized protein YbjQ (UPF0145 family)